MIEQLYNNKLFYSLYFQSLNNNYNLLSCINNWNNNYIELLKGTNLYSALNNNLNDNNFEDLVDLLNEIWKEYEINIKSSVDSHLYDHIDWSVNIFTPKTLQWARGQYLSRRYPEKLASVQESAIQARQTLSASRETSLGSMGAMVPILDILNHNDEHEWLTFKVEDGYLYVICNHPVKEGGELFSNYGDLSNERLLYAYGFALPNNKHDTVSLKLNVHSNISQQNVFYLQPGGLSGCPKEMWKILSSYYQSEEDESISEHNGNSDGLVEIGFEECELLYSFVQQKLETLLESRLKIDNQLANLLQSQDNNQNFKEKVVVVEEEERKEGDQREEENDIVHVQKYRRNNIATREKVIESNDLSSEVDVKLEYIKYYCDGQIRILKELVDDLKEILDNSEEKEEEGSDES